MKTSAFLCLALGMNIWAQSAPPAPPAVSAAELPPETVVATVDGNKVTAADLRVILRAISAPQQQQALKDPKAFLESYGFLKRLTDVAEKDKLDQRSPYRETLQYGRMQVLAQAAYNEKYQEIPVSADEQQKYYDTNKDQYTQAKVKVLYIAFSATPPPAGANGKKVLTEAEAQSKIGDILKQVRGGADFVKMVKEHSEDLTSKAKDGDFGVIRKSDKIPDNIKKVIFALKSGEVSEPVRQPNGFYLFRLEDLSVQPYAQVKDSIFNEIKTKQLQEWVTSLHKSIAVKVENEAFFAPKPQPPTLGPAAPNAKK